MKPVYLEMNYFGPHEHSVIDFRKLEEAPIFLISGDTGAGKSTIFDAMTFALFGNTTNDGTDGRAAKEMRSQFAPADQPTEITFYFEQGDLLYRVIRRPEQVLAKKSGRGMTKKGATAKLAIMDTVNGVETKSIAAKAADVGSEITGILNLTAEQFKKIILLPQNDFSEFLKSKTSDKENILKKIFGTQLYTQFAAKLKEQYDQQSRTGEAFTAKLAAQIEADVWQPEEREQLQHQAPEQQVETMQTLVANRQTSLTQAQAKTDKLTATVAQANQDFQAARDLDQKFQQLATTQAEYQAQVVEQAANIKADQQHLDELKWAEPLRETVHDCQTKRSEQKQLNADYTQVTAEVTQAVQKNQQAQAALKELANQAAQVAQKQTRIDELNGLIPQVQRVEQLASQLTTLKPQLAQTKAADHDQQVKINALTAKINDQKAALPASESLETTRQALVAQKEQFVETMTPLVNQLAVQRNAVDQAQQKIVDHDQQLVILNQQQATAQQTFAKQRGKRQALMIAQLQKELVDGAPCVVCGSTDHSHMVKTLDANETELKQSMTAVDDAQNALAAANKAVETATQQQTQLTTEHQQLVDQAAAIQQQITTTYQHLVATITLTLPAEFDLATVKQVFKMALQKIETQLTAIKQAQQTIQTLEAQLKAAQEQASADHVQFIKLQTSVNEKQRDLKTAQAALPVGVTSTALTTEKNQLQTAVTAYQDQKQAVEKAAQVSQLAWSQAQTRLTGIKTQLTNNHELLATLTTKIKTTLADSDAPTSDSAVLQQWLTDLNQGTLTALEVKIARYHQNQQRLEQALTDLTTTLKAKQRPNLTVLQQTLTTMQAQKDQAIATQTVAQASYTAATRTTATVEKLLQQQGTFAKKFAETMSLYNIVTGKNGNDNKLRLETYVVQNYLRRVLAYANQHFINLLSNNRYSFELANSTTDKRTDHGLDINVYDNETGATRPSNTLSGGETFIAALSIALSLSEVVQSSANGVQIDALFVDEGFGSLDDETLGKAMQALETIGENRMVGVISHIESMKQTIGQQLLITKQGDGRSTITLINK